jgi:tetratricopeptide (TPR) repeat protein
MASIGPDLCLLYFRAGEHSETIDVAPKVIALLDKTKRQSEFFGKPYNVYSTLHALCATGMGMFGKFGEGQVLLERGIDFALKIKDLTALAWSEGRYGTMLNLKGDWKNSVEHYQNAIRYYEEGRIVFQLGVISILLGEAYCHLGELETALECVDKGIKIHSDVGAKFGLDHFYGVSSMVYLEEEALKISQKNHNKWTEGFAWIHLGRIFGKAGKSQVGKAEECILRAIKILEELKFKPLYSQGYYFLGELYADMGQHDKALENLKKAEGLFREMGMEYWLDKTRETMVRL